MSTSLIPSSSKRFFNLSVDNDRSGGRIEGLEFNLRRVNRFLVEAKDSIQATLSFFEFVRR